MKKPTIGTISGQVPQIHRGTQENKLHFRCMPLRTKELAFHILAPISHNYRDIGYLGEALKVSVIASYPYFIKERVNGNSGCLVPLAKAWEPDPEGI